MTNLNDEFLLHASHHIHNLGRIKIRVSKLVLRQLLNLKDSFQFLKYWMLRNIEEVGKRGDFTENNRDSSSSVSTVHACWMGLEEGERDFTERNLRLQDKLQHGV